MIVNMLLFQAGYQAYDVDGADDTSKFSAIFNKTCSHVFKQHPGIIYIGLNIFFFFSSYIDRQEKRKDIFLFKIKFIY